MSASHGSDESMHVPQAHDVFPGRLRGNVAGGPDGSSASGEQIMEAARMEAATDDGLWMQLIVIESPKGAP